MKNNFLIILFLLLITGVVSSCKKLIKIPANPPTAITQSQQFADSVNAMTAVVGIYSYDNQGLGFAFEEGDLSTRTGLSSDELSSTETSDADNQQFYSYGLTQLNDYVSSLWSNVYTTIYPVNAVIESVKGNSNLSASFVKQVTGEMLVVRSLYYFNLINLFGAVPLVTSTGYGKSADIPRTSVDSVYGQIISDLTTAEQNLTVSYPSAGHVRPNLYTALTLMAKVHLYLGDWQDAYNEADSVINSGIFYSLEPDLNNVFLDGSEEAIWQLPVTGNQIVAEASTFIPYSPGTVPNYLLTPYLLNAFESGDQRRQDWVDSVTVNVGGNIQIFYYPHKYKNTVGGSIPAEDYMIFRLGEVYLIRAEAAAHLDNLNQALSDLDKIRNRAGLPNSTASGQTDILNAIMHERQVELFTEWGSRWFDLKRTGTAGAVLGSEKQGWQANAALYPIPQGQLQLDNLLTQNPGY
ncbi:MAG TPA: RagB/SusD family nutrient uptake outer membrane protein [Ginsengibacter sp.]